MYTDAPLLIGIVGAGAISRNSHIPVLMNTPNVRIAWIYDHRPEASKALAAAYGLKHVNASTAEQLPDCDVALLAIPVDARSPYLQTFAARGTAVLCEKPFATSASQHERAQSTFSPSALGAGFMRRFFRSTLLLRQIATQGFFGPLLRIDISEGNRSKGSGTDGSFLDDSRWGASRGVLTDLGSHSIDLALYVSHAIGFDVQSCTRILDGSVDRKVMATVRLRSGSPHTVGPVELTYNVSWLDRQDNRIQLTFAHATVWSGLGPASEVYVGDPSNPRGAISLGSRATGATTYNQAFFLEWQDFLDGFRENRESLVSARSTLLTTSLVEALLTGDEFAHA